MTLDGQTGWNRMKEEVARSVLRILAIATMLIGVVLTMQSAILVIGLREAMEEPREFASYMVEDLGGYGIVAQAATIVVGAALYLASPALAKRVAA